MTKQILSMVFSMALVLGAPVVATAANPPVVYHSPTMDGVNPGTPHSFLNYNETLDLYYSPGPNVPGTGEACLNGTGDEICGITIEIVSTGDVELDAFNEDVTSDLVFNFTPPNSLKINRLNGTVGDSSWVRLGSLDISVGTTGGDISVATASEATGAALQTLAVNDNGTIAVPEPGVALSLLIGAGALVFASRRVVGVNK